MRLTQLTLTVTNEECASWISRQHQLFVRLSSIYGKPPAENKITNVLAFSCYCIYDKQTHTNTNYLASAVRICGKSNKLYFSQCQTVKFNSEDR